MAGRGRFITLEGGEGTGKTTQVQRLAARLRAGGRHVVTTREPGGSDGGRQIRDLVVSGAADRWDAVGEALLMYAARRDHVMRLIEPGLAGGAWIVCDRFSDSTMAYQGYAGGLGRDWISELDRLTLNGFGPDLTLVLDLDPGAGLRRAAGRDRPDRFERKGTTFHQILRNAFLDIARREPARVRVIDADRDPDEVEAAIFDAVARALPDMKDAG